MSPSSPPFQQQQQQQLHLTRAYRGGFSTSICDLFNDPSRKSDCCALACCGILLSDRNHYIVSGGVEIPSPWWKRIMMNLGIPMVTLLVLVLLAGMVATEDNSAYFTLVTIGVMAIVVAALLVSAKRKRVQLRQAIMIRMHQARYGRDDDNSNNNAVVLDENDESDVVAPSRVVARVHVDSYLRIHRHDTVAVHGTCSCFSKDILYTIDTNDNHTIDDNDDDDDDMEDLLVQGPPPTDFCTCLWQTLAAMFFGWCCGCWFQCCGMCAIGQEDRELQRLFPKETFQMDYVTFQPYADYYAPLQDLRNNGTRSFWKHCRTLSRLSHKLLGLLGLALLVLAIIALSHLDKKFEPINLLVVLATLFQAFFILHFVHWRWNRFDLSFDAVIKYFSSGFILCTAIAMLYEMIVSFLLNFVTGIIVGIDLGIEGFNPNTEDPEAAKEYMRALQKEHIWLLSFFVFLNAFVIAALVEELTKYFGFWMVEHPDLMDPKVLATMTTTATTTTTSDDNEPITPMRSLQSRGAAITIAMVATALGFACCENFLYVFVYTPASVSSEISTLIARSIFPVHPICAAIQSIGVCRRDLEGDRSCQLGKIILPALLLHGTFDFVLMILALWESLYGPLTTNDDDNTSAPQDDATENPATDEFASMAGLATLISSVGIVILGIVYYMIKATSQRKRLIELDQREHEDDGSALLV